MQMFYINIHEREVEVVFEMKVLKIQLIQMKCIIIL